MTWGLLVGLHAPHLVRLPARHGCGKASRIRCARIICSIIFFRCSSSVSPSATVHCWKFLVAYRSHRCSQSSRALHSDLYATWRPEPNIPPCLYASLLLYRTVHLLTVFSQASLTPDQAVNVFNDRLASISKVNTDIADWLQVSATLTETLVNIYQHCD